MIDGVPSIVDLNEQVISTLGAVSGLLGEGVASIGSRVSARPRGG